jgi:hypothetical protein
MSKEGGSSTLNQYLSASLVLAVLSQISFVFYFQNFGLQPFQFYEPSEVITNSTKDFVISLLFFYVYINISISAYFYSAAKKNPTALIKARFVMKKAEPKKIQKTKFIMLLDRYLVVIILGVMAISIAAMFYLPSFVSENTMQDVNLTSSFVLIISFLGILHINYNSSSHFDSDTSVDAEMARMVLPKIHPSIVLAVAGYIFCIILISSYKAFDARFDNKYIGSEFKLTNETIHVTPKVLLIGRSKEYIFFYNTPNSSLRIVKRSELIKEVLVNKRRSFFHQMLYTY